MKIIVEYNLPEEKEEFELTQKAWKLESALWRIKEEIFGPVASSGYKDERLNTDSASSVIHVLRDKFFEILSDEGLEL